MAQGALWRGFAWRSNAVLLPRGGRAHIRAIGSLQVSTDLRYRCRLHNSRPSPAMATEPDIRSAFLALSRFGYGARRSGNGLATAATDPRAFLKAELESPAIAVVNASTL